MVLVVTEDMIDDQSLDTIENNLNAIIGAGTQNNAINNMKEQKKKKQQIKFGHLKIPIYFVRILNFQSIIFFFLQKKLSSTYFNQIDKNPDSSRIVANSNGQKQESSEHENNKEKRKRLFTKRRSSLDNIRFSHSQFPGSISQNTFLKPNFVQNLNQDLGEDTDRIISEEAQNTQHRLKNSSDYEQFIKIQGNPFIASVDRPSQNRDKQALGSEYSSKISNEPLKQPSIQTQISKLNFVNIINGKNNLENQITDRLDTFQSRQESDRPLINQIQLQNVKIDINEEEVDVQIDQELFQNEAYPNKSMMVTRNENYFIQSSNNTFSQDQSVQEFQSELKDENIEQSREQINESVINCLICLDQSPDSILMKCGHGGILIKKIPQITIIQIPGVCYDCAVDIFKSNGECPLCRQVNQMIIFPVQLYQKQKIQEVLKIDTTYNNDEKNIFQVISSVKLVSKENS